MVEGRYGVVATHADRAAPDIDPAVALDGLGTRWLQLEASYKLYPCAHAIHAFIEAAGLLRAQHGLVPEAIARVTGIVPEHFAGQIAEPRAEKLQPRTPTHARASLPYAVAHMLRHGAVDVAAYAPDRIADPALLALAARVACVAEATPRLAFSGRLEIETTAGARFACAIDDARGSPARPLDDVALIEKFRACATRTLSETAADALLAAIMTIERFDRLDAVFQIVARGRRA